MSAVIFSGDRVRALKRALKLQDKATIFSGSVDPSVTATTGIAGDVYISDLTNKIYIKQDSGSSTNWEAQAYESFVSSGLTGKADTDLNNLTTTSINQSLIPDSDSTRNLGSGAARFDTVHVENVAAGSSSLSLNGTGITANSQVISNVGDPVSGQDAATKAYVDTLASGLKWKASAKVATTANITLSGEQTIDDVLTSASRVVVKDQSTASENGIYVSAAGAWSRSTDADSGLELESAAIFVQEGTVNADRAYVQTADNITIGVTSITFALFSANSFSGHDMITLSGGQISVDLSANAGLESTNPGNAAGQLQVKLNGSTLDRSSSGMKITDGVLLKDNGGSVNSIDVGSRILKTSGSSDSIDWDNKLLYGTGAVPSADYGNRILADAAQLLSLNWDSRLLGDITGTTSIDYANRLTYDSSGLESLDYENRQIKNTSGNITVSWETQYLYYTNGNVSVDWNNANLLDGNQVSSVLYGTRLLVDDTVSDSVDYQNRQLKSGATTKLSWSGTNIDVNTRKIINVVDPTSAQDAATKAYVDAGAISTEATVAFAEAQTNTTIFTFGGTVRAAALELSIIVDATSDSFAKYRFDVIKKGSTYNIMQEYVGDDVTGLSFDVDNSGNFIYSSSSYAGFVGANSKFKYKMISLSV